MVNQDAVDWGKGFKLKYELGPSGFWGFRTHHRAAGKQSYTDSQAAFSVWTSQICNPGCG